MFSIGRKSWLALLLLGMSVGGLSDASYSLARWQPIPITGIEVPGLADLDRLMTSLMAKYGVIGGALAVAKDGRLVYARGFGLADREANQVVQPESLFRIASVSKSITSVAILKLYEEGRLDLDAKVFRILSDLQPPSGASMDPRIQEINVRQLLQNSSGLVRSCFGISRENIAAAQAVGVPPPAGAEALVRYGIGKPLDFAPGTKFGYSTLGYCALGRLIERATGQKYEDYVRKYVLGPAGVTRMQIGHTLPEERVPGEVRYYDAPGAPLVASVYPPHLPIPRPYSNYVEGVDSGGGWIASTIDLLRFVTAVDGRRPPALLKPETVALMIARPSRPDVMNTLVYYGMGWVVRPVSNGVEWRHGGSLPGTLSLLVRRADGVAWAIVFNSEFPDGFLTQLDQGVSQTIDAVKEWPAHDLFGQYP